MHVYISHMSTANDHTASLLSELLWVNLPFSKASGGIHAAYRQVRFSIANTTIVLGTYISRDGPKLAIFTLPGISELSTMQFLVAISLYTKLLSVARYSGSWLIGLQDRGCLNKWEMMICCCMIGCWGLIGEAFHEENPDSCTQISSISELMYLNWAWYLSWVEPDIWVPCIPNRCTTLL